jgi:DNA-binding NtrC family response regulator
MKTILLVDNEEGMVNVLGEIMSRFGYRVIGKTDCCSALSIVREGTKVDLIITDYQMPGLDGLEFIARIKQMALPMPVIMLTGCTSIECYMKAVSLGAFVCVAKSVGVKDMGRIVKAALEGAEAGWVEAV